MAIWTDLNFSPYVVPLLLLAPTNITLLIRWFPESQIYTNPDFFHKNEYCLSRSPHKNNQYESRILATKFCLFTFWVNIYKTKVLNKGQSTSKNANITVWTKNLKTLCYTLNWWHWFSCFVKLVVRMSWTRYTMRFNEWHYFPFPNRILTIRQNQTLN